MAEIEELLGKLKELDSETWKRGNELMGEVFIDSPFVESLYEAITQLIVQEAIMSKTSGASHQWIYHARGRVSTSGPDYRALVGVLEVVDCAVVDRTHEASGDTPAEALLAAYIAFLEAEAAR